MRCSSAWPKWCRGGDPVQFRVHAVEPYKLGLWRYGYEKEQAERELDAFIRDLRV